MSNDWIEWKGDGSDEALMVPRRVDIKYRDGSIRCDISPSHHTWVHDGAVWDIVAYRKAETKAPDSFGQQNQLVTDRPMHEKYPAYYKDVSHLTSVDVYRVHRLFDVNDPVIHHASKKLLMAGARTGEKFEVDDIREARDTLTRWLDMEEEDRK